MLICSMMRFVPTTPAVCGGTGSPVKGFEKKLELPHSFHRSLNAYNTSMRFLCWSELCVCRCGVVGDAFEEYRLLVEVCFVRGRWSLERCVYGDWVSMVFGDCIVYMCCVVLSMS